MINTSGYRVDVMPQLAPVDPRLYAFDPTKITEGAMQGLQLASTVDSIKTNRAKAAEEAATRQARIDQANALSQLAVLQSEHEKATAKSKLAATLAQLGYTEADMKGKFEDLGQVRSSEQEAREFATGQRKFQTSDMEANKAMTDFKLAHMADDHILNTRLINSQISENLGKIEEYQAKAKALADKAGQVRDKMADAWATKMGGLAASIGLTPQKMIDIYHSKATGKNGLLSTELASLASMIQNATFYQNPQAHLSPELKAVIGEDGVAALSTGVVARTMRHLGQYDGTQGLHGVSDAMPPQPQAQPSVDDGIDYPPQTEPVAQPATAPVQRSTGPLRDLGLQPAEVNAPSVAAPAPAIPVIKIDKDFNVQRPKEDQQSAVDDPKTTEKLMDAGIIGGQLLRGAKSLKSIPTVIEKSIPFDKRAALKAFMSKLSKTELAKLAPKIVPALARGGGAAINAATSLPVTAAYAANKYGGNVLGALAGKGWEDGENVVGMEIRGANQPSFDEQKANAQIDQIAQRIQMVVHSSKLSEEQKKDELTKLLTQRELMLSVIKHY